MDYGEFKQHVADYAEGTLDDELRSRMDAARTADPACDRLAGLHEKILSALVDTPEVAPPAGLIDVIMTKARTQEQLLAAEQKAFRRGMWLGVAGAATGAVALAIFLFMIDLSTGAGSLEVVRAMVNGWIAKVSNSLYGWLWPIGTFTETEVSVPFLGFSVHLYILLLSAFVTGILAWFREGIREAIGL